jgi:hypothetical protein
MAIRNDRFCQGVLKQNHSGRVLGNTIVNMETLVLPKSQANASSMSTPALSIEPSLTSYNDTISNMPSTSKNNFFSHPRPLSRKVMKEHTDDSPNGYANS